ncbi:MAG: peptidase [Nocardioides sp.]|jgi:murein DD-endopeptidase MepM/ murein hydrolase activator NlpD|uniref:M23 family metallopeptidase n=1 Tax=Nocardioides sp. TaxID=35761 RepID=UPI00260FAF12|nr:M23 family metallopeptidase [Nocardioides sp.]MCW2835076.1 peptidase [Nocardioides sp.]
MQPWRHLLPVLTLSLPALLLGVVPLPAQAESDPVGVWPLRPTPEVMHAFEPPSGPYGAGHRGADLAGVAGQSVHSAMAGAIAFVGHIAGKPVVTVSHGETRTTYEPVSSDLEVGDPVPAGRRIGSLELPFSHCFPRACLHWGWLRGETYLDPLTLVGTRRVRLLPLWRDEPVDYESAPWWRPSSVGTLPLPYAAWLPLRDFLP